MLFLYGTLRHPPLLAAVLGRDPGALRPARLEGHEVTWVEGEMIPMIRAGGNGAEGALFDPTPADRARLDAYETGFSYRAQEVQVTAAEGAVPAEVYVADHPAWRPGAAFDLNDWARAWGDVAVPAAAEFVARLEAGVPLSEAVRFYPSMQARAWARHLARKTAGPATLRTPGNDVEITREHRGFDGFFRFRHFDLRHRTFDGGMTPEFTRECFIGFDAALVLPWDPATGEVLLVEQLRLAAALRGDPNPRSLEPVAGLIEAGESPEESARRETVEEAGLELRELIPVARTYPSPGYSTEFHHCFIGVADLAGADGRAGGAEGEMEDIRTHVLPLETALDLIDSGEITVTPLAMMLLWLARRRDAGTLGA